MQGAPARQQHELDASRPGRWSRCAAAGSQPRIRAADGADVLDVIVAERIGVSTRPKAAGPRAHRLGTSLCAMSVLLSFSLYRSALVPRRNVTISGMTRYSWQSYPIATGKPLAEWITGRPALTHRWWSQYSAWVAVITLASRDPLCEVERLRRQTAGRCAIHRRPPCRRVDDHRSPASGRHAGNPSVFRNSTVSGISQPSINAERSR